MKAHFFEFQYALTIIRAHFQNAIEKIELKSWDKAENNVQFSSKSPLENERKQILQSLAIPHAKSPNMTQKLRRRDIQI